MGNKTGRRVESLKQREQKKGYMANSIVNLENIWGKIGAVSRNEIILAVLQDEIEVHKSRLEPRDTGHLHTAISVIQNRIEELT